MVVVWLLGPGCGLCVVDIVVEDFVVCRVVDVDVVVSAIKDKNH